MKISMFRKQDIIDLRLICVKPKRVDFWNSIIIENYLKKISMSELIQTMVTGIFKLCLTEDSLSLWLLKSAYKGY